VPLGEFRNARSRGNSLDRQVDALQKLSLTLIFLDNLLPNFCHLSLNFACGSNVH
jgi:hypothetical protein